MGNILMGCIFKMCILYWLINNIRCIEIRDSEVAGSESGQLINNIRCIEILPKDIDFLVH